MSKTSTALQIHLPRLEADGVTHERGCECPRCDAGFGPSDRGRAVAARIWEDKVRLEKAQAALERKQERRRIKALALKLELEQEARRTAARIAEEQKLVAKLAEDDKLRLLLASRRAGLGVEEALAAVERRFGPRTAGARVRPAG